MVLRDACVLNVAIDLFCSDAGVGEEAVEPDAGDQGAEARAQHLRWGKWRSTDQGLQGKPFFLSPSNRTPVPRTPILSGFRESIHGRLMREGHISEREGLLKAGRLI